VSSDGAAPTDPIKVLIADDQGLVRAGFRMILEIEPDLEVVGEAADGEQAVVETESRRPDVVLMDVRMPGLDGIAATRRITSDLSSTARVVMLTTFDMDEYVYGALQAGASGFLLKDVPPEQLVAGIRAVHAGESLLAPSVTRRLIQSYLERSGPVSADARARLEALTAREREVLGLLCRRRTNDAIAAELAFTPKTVRNYVSSIFGKLHVADRAQAIVKARDAGLDA